MLNNLISMALNGMLQKNPMMTQFNQFLGGKSVQDQMKTLINIAGEKGFDINEKIFSDNDLQQLGINLKK